MCCEEFCFRCDPFVFKMTILFLIQGICFCWANFFNVTILIWCKEFVTVVTNLFLTEWRFCFWCEKFVFVETNLFQLMWRICFRPEEFCFAVGEFFFAVRDLFLMWLIGFWCAEFVFSLWWIWFCCEGFVFNISFCFPCEGLVFAKTTLFWSD